MTRLRLRRIFWRGAAAILVVAALIAIAALLGGGFSETEGKILWTLGVLFLTGSTVIASLALAERATQVPLGKLTFATCPVAFILLSATAWLDFDVGAAVGKLDGTLALIVASQLVVATQRLILRHSRLERIATATQILVGLATGVTVVFVWIGRDPGDAGIKAIVVCWILAALGWFLVPVLQRLSASTAELAALAGDERIGVPERVVATLDGVDLVVTTAPKTGDVLVDLTGLDRAERVALRKRTA